MKRIIQILIIVSMLIIATIPYSVGAQAGANFYVSTTGSDNNNGSQSSPFKTIQNCVTVAQTGDTCSVQAGIYNERFNVSKAITVICISARTCIIKGATLSSNAVVNGFYSLNSDTNDGGITGSGSGYKILNNKVEGSCMVGVELNGSNGLAEGNEILKSRQCSGTSGPDADGMRFFGSGHILRGNYIHDIFYDSVNVDAHIDCFQTWSGASNTLIENNICDVFTANSSRADSGANLEDDVATVFRHNYIRSYGKKILFESSSRDGIAEFNIFVGGPIISGAPTQYGLFADGNNETARNNLFWDIHNNNGTSVLFGIDNVIDNRIDNPQMNGYCSTSHPEIGVPCSVLPPTSTAGAPTATVTPTATIITGPYMLTSANPLNLNGIGETGLVTVSLNNIPAEGYASAEFTCTYNPSLVYVNNISIEALFRDDPVAEVVGPQNGGFIVAIAGSNGHKAIIEGRAFTFNVRGLQIGQTVIECTARVSKGQGILENILSIPTTLNVVGYIYTPTPGGNEAALTGQVLASKPVTVSLYNPDSSLAATTTANPDGTFSLTAPGGMYTVVAIAAGFLSAQGPVALVNGNTSTKPVVSLLAGDIDGNNIINQLDALTIGMNYNNTTPAAANLNNDGIINVLDLGILAQNYRQSGALAW